MDVKSISWLFIKQLLLFGVQVIVANVMIIIALLCGISIGLIYPADYAETVINKNEEQIRNSVPFDDSVLPCYTTYSLYDENDQLIVSTMSDEEKEVYIQRLNGNYGSKYNLMREIKRVDGRIVICYDMAAKYSNPFFNQLLPNVELSIVLTSFFLCIFILFRRSRKVRKIVRKQLTPLLDDINSINNKNLYEISGDTSVDKLSNITEIATVQKALQEMKQALTQALKAEWESEQKKKEDIAALAHDIKTPLTVVRGNAELLLEDALDIAENCADEKVKQVSDDIEELSQGILRGCDRIQVYISLLMDQSRPVIKTELSVAEFNKELISQITELCRTNQIDVSLTECLIPEDMKINIDGIRTQRAIINLVRNAIEHTDRTKGIEVYLTFSGKCVTYTIRDYGKGFSAEALGHCTEQFFTENTARTGEHYGLGMYFANKVAKECNGRLEIKNLDDGASVSFCII